jgi:hypothetical protein
MFGIFKSRKTVAKSSTHKTVRNKNGSTSSFTKVKKQGGKTSWVKTGGSNWKGSTVKKKR